MPKFILVCINLLFMVCLSANPLFGQEQDKMTEQVQIKEAKVNGVTLNYIETGEGEPIIFVHGTLGDYRTWTEQIGPFSNNYQVIAYSRRYHFPNPWPQDSSNFSVTIHAKDLVEFIKHLKLKQVHLVGHSFGAFAALLATRNYPELIQSLILGEPPVMPLLETSSEGDPNLQVREAFIRGETEEAIRQFINIVLGEGAYEKLPKTIRANMMDNSRELEGAMKEENLFAPFSCEDAGKVNVPTLLIDGELSPEVFGLINDTLERCLPNSKRIVIPSASHGFVYENPQDFNEEVIRFLKTQ
ncbi:alpha/beta hydrolase [Balneolaceae bacterium YR4-1]|uniref:Alpha/beta hydrolase n=1 Tax=Halalkalibaculum roseum TaxID=2709311 RepID=A0A6M1SSH6_9BACT|nr:alpha/beta hydrolase [Halalkalibaculum roseum]NGP75126.1 alpha/beta hydrolase [Halalkalibaculum roseum]